MVEIPYSRLEPPVLAELCERKLGKDWQALAPDDRAKLLEEQGIKLDQAGLNKLEAYVTLKTTDFPKDDFFVFEKVTIGLNDRVPSFDRIEEASPGEISYSVYLMGKEGLSDEVKRYIAASLFDFGLIFAPPSLDFVQPYLDELVSDYGKALQNIWKDKGIMPPAQKEKIASIELYLDIKKRKIDKDKELING